MGVPLMDSSTSLWFVVIVSIMTYPMTLPTTVPIICMTNVHRGLRCTYCAIFRSRSSSWPCDTEL